MASGRTQLRARAYSNAEVSQLARDVQGHIDATPVQRIVELTQQYAEPMYLALEREPAGILALRIRQDDSPETVLNHGTAVEFSWVSTGTSPKGRAKINNIDGMSAGATLYRFTFWVTYG